VNGSGIRHGRNPGTAFPRLAGTNSKTVSPPRNAASGAQDIQTGTKPGKSLISLMMLVQLALIQKQGHPRGKSPPALSAREIANMISEEGSTLSKPLIPFVMLSKWH
jgi:hypothetical protein